MVTVHHKSKLRGFDATGGGVDKHSSTVIVYSHVADSLARLDFVPPRQTAV